MAYPRRQLCKALTGYRGNNPRCTRTMPDRWAPHRSRRSSSPRAMGNTIAIAEVTCPIAGHPPPSTSRLDSSMSRYRHLTVQPHPRVVQLSRFDSSTSRYRHLTVQPHPPVVQLSRFDSSMRRYRHLTVQPHPRVVQLSWFDSSMRRYRHLTVQPHPRLVQLGRLDSSMS